MMTMAKILLRTLALSLALSLVIGALFAVQQDGTWGSFFVSSGIAMMYSAAIGVPATIVFTRLRRWFANRNDAKAWFVYIGVVAAVTAIGTFAVGVVLVAVGVVSAGELWDLFSHSIQISAIIAVPMTIAGFAYGKLQARIEKASKLAVEARLASLESRVRPHFLFNALNSAIALIPEDPKRAEKVLERLAHLLRFSLDTAATVTLGDELTIVRDYLEIEQVRFGERLRYDVDVPDELLELRIPAFAVQTLVENSVKYAVSARKAGARVVVRARRDGDRLQLAVTDDGPGFSGPIWVPGHGLDGLRARLDAVYGQAAKLVAPAPGIEAGAGVTIELPGVAS
jgi:signal transduction histidine kinase